MCIRDEWDDEEGESGRQAGRSSPPGLVSESDDDEDERMLLEQMQILDAGQAEEQADVQSQEQQAAQPGPAQPIQEVGGEMVSGEDQSAEKAIARGADEEGRLEEEHRAAEEPLQQHQRERECEYLMLTTRIFLRRCLR